jgi:catechol 2,3-dioxygenase-like lactoylglutathione lyase family enzyme
MWGKRLLKIDNIDRQGLAINSEPPAGLFRGIFESHLHVADLEKAMRFYGEVLGLELGLKDTDRRAALYWVGRNRSTMLGVWERLPWAACTNRNVVVSQHVAFEVAFDDLGAAICRMKNSNVVVRNFFDQVTDEPSVFGWIPAASIYFNDVDGHLLELIAKLDGIPAPDVGVISLSEWSRFNLRKK